MEQGNDNPTNEPAEQEPSSSFLSTEQKKRLAQEFSLDNFQLVRPPNGEDYVRVTLPQSVEPETRALRVRLLQEAQSSIDFMSELVARTRTLDQQIRDYAAALNLSEQDEIALRQNPETAKLLDLLGGPGEDSAVEGHERNLRRNMHNKMLYNLSSLLARGLNHAMFKTFDKFRADREKELWERNKSEDYIKVVLREEVEEGRRPYETMMDLINPSPETMGLVTKARVKDDWRQACRFILFDSKGELFFKHPEDLVEPEDVEPHIIKGEPPQKKFPAK